MPFLADVLIYARDEGVDVDSIEARALLPVVDRFWTTPGYSGHVKPPFRTMGSQWRVVG
ncbi:MAG: hypothetical protein JSR26_10870 [Proteobacteria bacterium]|nr:hypothetical protein [Pseudomonadota bacterium]